MLKVKILSCLSIIVYVLMHLLPYEIIDSFNKLIRFLVINFLFLIAMMPFVQRNAKVWSKIHNPLFNVFLIFAHINFVS